MRTSVQKRMGDTTEMNTPNTGHEPTTANTMNTLFIGDTQESQKKTVGHEHCNGHDTYRDVITETPEQTIVPALEGSNGSARPSRKPKLDLADISLNTTKDSGQNEATTQSPKITNKFPRMSLRASFSHRNGKKKIINTSKKFISSAFGLSFLIFIYMSLGACAFVWMESTTERTRRAELIMKRYDLTNRLMDCNNGKECMNTEIKNWEQELLHFPLLYIYLSGEGNSSEPKIWNWPNAFYGCFSIITTIGYGTIAPVTPWGRLFAVVYAIIGIPLMLLLVADIGSQLARFVKIAIITQKHHECRFWKHKQTKKNVIETIDSPSLRNRHRDTFDPKLGQVNLGLVEDEDPTCCQSNMAHINGIHLDIEVTNSDSSCDERADEVTKPTRKRKTYVNKCHQKHTPSSFGTTHVKAFSCRDAKPRMSTSDGSCKISADDNQSEHTDVRSSGEVSQNSADFQLYDDTGKSPNECEHPDSSELSFALSNHQIKEYDSVSQYSAKSNERIVQSHNVGRMLDVPKIGSVSLEPAEMTTNGSVVSGSSSICTTPSNAPTEIYKSDVDVPEVTFISTVDGPCLGSDVNDASSIISSRSKTVSTDIPVFRIDNASDSDTERRTSNTTNTTLGKQPQVSCVSLNMEHHVIRIPLECREQFAKRDLQKQKSVQFSGALGSFSAVSETDIALFSIPLWVALLLLLIYLLIGSCCYWAMENWTMVDSFYYAFISLSTIGFGDLYFVPESFEGALIFNFVYCFFGLSFVSMVWGLSSREFKLLANKIARNLGYYKSRRWRRTVKGLTSRLRQRSIKRWSSKRRNGMKEPSTTKPHEHTSDNSPYSSADES